MLYFSSKDFPRFISAVVASFNCTSPTPQSLFDALGKELNLKQSHPPVQNFSQPMVITLDVTVVGILGVVSHQTTQATFTVGCRQNTTQILLVSKSKSTVFIYDVSSLERKRTIPDNVPVASSGEYSPPKH